MLRTLAAGALALSLLLPFSASAAGDAMKVESPYVRLAPPNAKATGAFMRLRNESGEERRLLRAESPVAARVELHTHIDDNGVMKMRAVPHIAIPAHALTDLKPGSFHVMLIDLKAPLQAGDAVPITLHFDDGSRQRVEAPVRMPHAGAPMHAQPAHGGMQP